MREDEIKATKEAERKKCEAIERGRVEAIEAASAVEALLKLEHPGMIVIRKKLEDALAARETLLLNEVLSPETLQARQWVVNEFTWLVGLPESIIREGEAAEAAKKREKRRGKEARPIKESVPLIGRTQ